MPAPGQIVGVLLYRGWDLWRWEIYDSVGLWNGYVAVPLAAPLEEASERPGPEARDEARREGLL